MSSERPISLVDQFYNNTPTFLDELIYQCKSNRVDLGWLSIDHVCMRVSSDLMYVLGNEELENYNATIVGQKDHMIDGRPITLWKLPIPIFYKNDRLDKEQIIDVLELAAPKQNHQYKDGIQHAEFYPHGIYLPLSNSIRFLEKYLQKVPFIDREKSFHGQYNPTIAHSFTKDLEVKIHPHSIEEVVKYEAYLLNPTH